MYPNFELLINERTNELRCEARKQRLVQVATQAQPKRSRLSAVLAVVLPALQIR